MIDIREHGIGGGFSVNKPFPIGDYSLIPKADIDFEVSKSYNVNRVAVSAFNHATGELWALSSMGRTIEVYKDNSLVRTIFLKSATDMNLASITFMVISNSGRVYLSGFGTYYVVMYEISTSTGDVINNVPSMRGEHPPWHTEIIDGEIWMGHGTGRWDVFTLDLEIIQTYLWGNSVHNTNYGNAVDKENGIFIYSQTSNNVTVIRRMSDGTVVGTIPYHQTYNLVVDGYVISQRNSTLRKYSLTWSLISEVVLSGGSFGNLVNLNDCVAVSYHDRYYGYLVIDIESLEVIHEFRSGPMIAKYQYHTYTEKITAIGKTQLATQFPAVFGLYTLTNMIVKR